MKFGVPWGAKEIRPEARETAKEAARRSGMSLEDWLNSVILRQAQQDGIEPPAHSGGGGEVADLHQRLDDLTRRIEQVTRAGPAVYAPRHRSSDAGPSSPPPLAPAMPQPLPSVQLPPGLDHAVAEIAARRRALNGETAPAPPQPQIPVTAPAPMAARAAPAAPVVQPEPASPSTTAAPVAPLQPALPSQNLSGLENQLRRITDQIETLRTPGIDEAVNALRRELGEIGRALADAMPRHAIEAIEKQILEVAMRIDEGRQAGVDQQALARIEQGLAEVRDALHGLTPAENLVGFNEAVGNLAYKIDLIIAQKDPATLDQLEHAITTLRGMAENVASNEAVTQLANEVLMLGEKIDYIARTTGGGDALNNLDQRVAAIADALGERAQNGGTVPPRLESLVQSLSDKIEQIQLSKGDTGAISHLEHRIGSLVEKLDASQSRLSQLEAIERGLGDLLAHMEEARANKGSESAQANHAPAVVELKHNMDRTQDALEAVHGTLGHVVDRLAMIEKEFRSQGRRQLHDDGEADTALPVGKLAVRAVSPVTTQTSAPSIVPASTPLAPDKADAQPPPPPASPPAPAPSAQPQAAARRRVATSLPFTPDPSGDQPIEPGSGPPKFSARIAASEAALAGSVPAEAATGGKTSFIAAARRAAQAAMKQGGARAPESRERGEAVAELDEDGRPSLRARIMKRMKSVFIAASIIAVVVGGFQIAGNWLKFAEAPTNETEKAGPADPTKTEPSKSGETSNAPNELQPAPDRPQPAPVSPLGKPEELKPLSGLNGTPPTTPSLFNPPILGAPPTSSATPASPPPQTKNDVTGSIPSATRQQSEPSAEPTPADHERLPATIGSARLRNAALAGDAGAAYEVAVRLAEGRGVRVNMADAAYWFAQAARRGLVPAQFRYASMLEKGQGVKKDQSHARELYLAAAAKGSAKAMHNLAVLYAEGIDSKPDYSAAVKWFRLAAKHGIADSQYNLGVLAARGFGTDKDFAESYKWFALAAAQGDQESAKKRDEIASHLDAPTLASAQRATETFTVEPQPKTATTIPKPQGGWDNAAAAPTPASKNKPDPQPLPPSAPLSLGAFTFGKR